MKYLISIFLIAVIMFQVFSLTGKIHPVSFALLTANPLREASIKSGMGDPGEKILKAVTLASKQTDLSESLLLSLMYSESSFKPKAVSSKRYNGLMQIPQSVYYEDANCLIGAKILIEKLKITNGDYKKAITIYKGWPVDHPEGRKQAENVIAMAMKVRSEL